MRNRYPGTCSRCGQTVPAGAGNVEKKGEKWVVAHDECPEITSGLGIGGVGSDDYNISITEGPGADIGSGRGFGARGIRYEEACGRCGRISDVCNWCGNCEKHCIC